MRLRRWHHLLLCLALFPWCAPLGRAATCDTMHRLWSISGAGGQQVTVPFILARRDQSITPVSGMDFKLIWDPTLIAVDHFQAGELCYGQHCFPNLFPTCDANGCNWGSLPNGHSIIAVPKKLADWQDRGVLMMVNLSSPTAINTAYLDQSGQVVGNDQVVFEATFTLLADIAPEQPTGVWMAGASFSQSSGFTLYESVEEIAGNRVIVLDDQKPANVPPYAEAGPAQHVVEGTVVTLDGSGCCDYDNNLTAVHWEQIGGPLAILAGENTSAPSFIAPEVKHAGDTAVFKITAEDTAGLSSQDVVVVHISDQVLSGDFNDNGKLDLADAILGLQAANGEAPGNFNLAADADGDGHGGPADTVYILRQLAGTGGG